MTVQPFPIEREYKKNPDITPDDVQKLQDWVKTQPHLPGKYLTELDILIAFHCCERSAEVAKQVIDLHYTLRTLFTSFFKLRQLDAKVEQTLDTILVAPLPMPAPDGSRAVYIRLVDLDPRRFNFSDTIRTFMMTFDLWQLEEGTWPGFIIIIDLEGVTLGHIAKLEIMIVRQTLYFLQECMFVKLKQVHFMNAPYFMDKIMMLLKPFMKKALLDIIHIHQPGSQEPFTFVPKEALPKDAGGEFKGFKTLQDDLRKRFKANQDYFRDENRRRVDESLRPDGKQRTVEELFGIQGSFKKLDID